MISFSAVVGVIIVVRITTAGTPESNWSGLISNLRSGITPAIIAILLLVFHNLLNSKIFWVVTLVWVVYYPNSSYMITDLNWNDWLPKGVFMPSEIQTPADELTIETKLIKDKPLLNIYSGNIKDSNCTIGAHPVLLHLFTSYQDAGFEDNGLDSAGLAILLPVLEKELTTLVHLDINGDSLLNKIRNKDSALNEIRFISKNPTDYVLIDYVVQCYRKIKVACFEDSSRQAQDKIIFAITNKKIALLMHIRKDWINFDVAQKKYDSNKMRYIEQLTFNTLILFSIALLSIFYGHISLKIMFYLFRKKYSDRFARIAVGITIIASGFAFYMGRMVISGIQHGNGLMYTSDLFSKPMLIIENTYRALFPIAEHKNAYFMILLFIILQYILMNLMEKHDDEDLNA